MVSMKSTRFPDRLFITGTDTGVGKTLVSAILMAGLKGIYWKPVQSGLEDITDTEWVREKTGLPAHHFFPETYRLKLPLSPHASAAHEGLEIDLGEFHIPETGKSDHIIIEGAGGIMVPLNRSSFMIDLMKKLDSPVLVVTSSSLGTINHTLLSLEKLKSEGLEILGVVMNGLINNTNREAIEYYGGMKVLAEIEPMNKINPKSLEECFKENFTSGLGVRWENE